MLNLDFWRETTKFPLQVGTSLIPHLCFHIFHHRAPLSHHSLFPPQPQKPCHQDPLPRVDLGEMRNAPPPAAPPIKKKKKKSNNALPSVLDNAAPPPAAPSKKTRSKKNKSGAADPPPPLLPTRPTLLRLMLSHSQPRNPRKKRSLVRLTYLHPLLPTRPPLFWPTMFHSQPRDPRKKRSPVWPTCLHPLR